MEKYRNFLVVEIVYQEKSERGFVSKMVANKFGSSGS